MADIETLSRFQPGDVLIVQPGDEDDPEAQATQGLECTFIRYVEFTGHCVVRFDGKARPMYFRPSDLKRKEG